MVSSLRALAAAAAAALTLTAVPALAQYSSEFVPAKLLHQGTTSKSIAGSGTVTVQVQVNADGSHKAIKVIKSTNSGDNAAAMEIAQTSSYRPAHRGSTPVTSFYDFRLRFNGRSVVNTPPEGEGTAGTGGGATPANRNQAESLAVQAVKMAQQNPTESLALAQKAMAINPSSDSKYALGVAQAANKQYADAIATLKEVRTAVFADPKSPNSAKVSIDTWLMTSYMGSNDTQDAQEIAAELKRLDPSSTLPGRVIGNGLLVRARAAGNAKNFDEAFKDYDEAAAGSDPDVTVTAYTEAALLVTKMDKPDYKRMQTYADKALALKPNDALANFAEGVAFTGQWAGSHDDATKKKAQQSLDKADQQAKAEGNEALSLQVESFEKKYLNAGPSGPSGGGR
ncbi:MAG: TonB family protein [Candidatus Eremiobacteraeota bacterium]|nr:TonB family protein [Candidatus Eremiobacteraeota bacterium]MBV9056282.1 TonB family protein [Candidatus Eremiobacteraeota bacterium]MBV9698553.1 TonB family protein [Candidatus Eremiobacteraeota bacterium]